MKHNGILQTKAQCEALAKKILAGGDSQLRRDAASMLLNRPDAIMARPASQMRYIELAESTDLGRPAGIMATLLRGGSCKA